MVGGDRMMPPDRLRGPRWFVGAASTTRKTSSATRPDDGPRGLGRTRPHRQALVRRTPSRVARCAAGLRALGVKQGDRVAGWLPNIPEAIIAMLATSSIGAVWTSCSPDFGVDGIVDRFGQTEPVVLLCCAGYRYNGKTHDCLPRLAEMMTRLPSVRHTVSCLSRRQLAAGVIGAISGTRCCRSIRRPSCHSSGSRSTIRSAS